MVSDETMMFSFGVEENRAAKVIKTACQAKLWTRKVTIPCISLSAIF